MWGLSERAARLADILSSAVYPGVAVQPEVPLR
jgi:hypothetical protein